MYTVHVYCSTELPLLKYTYTFHSAELHENFLLEFCRMCHVNIAEITSIFGENLAA